MITVKTQIYKDDNGDVIIIQSTSFPDGRGRNKWDRHTVSINKKQLARIIKLINDESKTQA